MIVNKIQFADLAGVGKASVTLSVQRGKLVQTPEGYIDTANPVNAEYLDKRKAKLPPDQQNKPLKKPRVKKPVTTTKLEKIDDIELPAPDVDIPDEIAGDAPTDEHQPDQLDKLAADIRLKKAQALRHELKYEQDKGLLIPLESVERAASKVGAELKIRLQDLPRRLAPRILAMARSGADDRSLQAMLEAEIDDGLESVRRALETPLV
jgi:hypothetical protein